MIPALCVFFFLLPVAFAALLNPFDKLKEIENSESIQKRLLAFLPVKDQMKFMLTCRDFHKLLNQDYDHFIKVITESRMTSYEEAEEEMKSDIRKLWKYFKIEMESRQVDFPFSIEIFDNMISGIFFWSPNSKDAIQTDNLNAFCSIFGTDYTRYYCLDRPLFPQIYLNLFKFPHADFEQDSREYFLIMNACRAPFLFDSMFKHLALDVYKVPREYLCSKLDKYNDLHYLGDLNAYQLFIQAAYAYFGLERFAMIVAIFVIIDELFRSFAPIVSGVLGALSITLFHVIVLYYYYFKYDRFDEYDQAALKRFSKIAAFIYPVMVTLFGSEAEVCLGYLQNQKYAYA